jgi:AcrR family transcriptional regulator
MGHSVETGAFETATVGTDFVETDSVETGAVETETDSVETGAVETETDSVETSSDSPCAPVRGRPRSAQSTEAILDAAAQLLDEIGYEDIHMQHVADRARVGLATIYRRWPTKSALFAEAVRRTDPLAALPNTGDAADDLAAAMRIYAHMLGDDDSVPDRRCQNFLAVVRSDPEVKAAYRDHVFHQMRGRLRALIVKVVGEDDPDLDARADLGPALLLYRREFLGQIEDPDAAGDEAAALMLRQPAR